MLSWFRGLRVMSGLAFFHALIPRFCQAVSIRGPGSRRDGINCRMTNGKGGGGTKTHGGRGA
eukprot:9472610-Pyramimonas_sp.AAC.3